MNLKTSIVLFLYCHLPNAMRGIWETLQVLPSLPYHFFLGMTREKSFQKSFAGQCVTKKPSLNAIKARVMRVHDGDTFTVRYNRKDVTIRTFGVDAPETDQPYGIEAQKFLKNLILHKDVDLYPISTSYDREVCYVFINNVCINEIMLREGLVWAEPRYSSHQPHYQTLQKNAKFHRLGLWYDPFAVAPWEWRKWHDKAVAHAAA